MKPRLFVRNPDDDMRRLQREAEAGDPTARLRYLTAARRHGLQLQPWEEAELRQAAGEDVAPWELIPLSYVFVQAYLMDHPDEAYRPLHGHGQAIQGRVSAVTNGGEAQNFYVVSHMYPFHVGGTLGLFRDFERYQSGRGAVPDNMRIHLDQIQRARELGMIVLAGRYPPGHGPQHGTDCFCHAQQFVVLGRANDFRHHRSDRVQRLLPRIYQSARIMTRRGRRWENNPSGDENLRRLERQAAEGDARAQAELDRLRLRLGQRELRRTWTADLIEPLRDEFGLVKPEELAAWEAAQRGQPPPCPYCRTGGGSTCGVCRGTGHLRPQRPFRWIPRTAYAAGIREVLKKAGVKPKSISVTTPDHSGAGSVYVRGPMEVVDGPFGRGKRYAPIDRETSLKIADVFGITRVPGAVVGEGPGQHVPTEYDLHPTHREDRSRPMEDYWHEEGLRLREEYVDAFVGAVKKELEREQARMNKRAETKRSKGTRKNPDDRTRQLARAVEQGDPEAAGALIMASVRQGTYFVPWSEHHLNPHWENRWRAWWIRLLLHLRWRHAQELAAAADSILPSLEDGTRPGLATPPTEFKAFGPEVAQWIGAEVMGWLALAAVRQVTDLVDPSVRSDVPRILDLWTRIHTIMPGHEVPAELADEAQQLRQELWRSAPTSTLSRTSGRISGGADMAASYYATDALDLLMNAPHRHYSDRPGAYADAIWYATQALAWSCEHTHEPRQLRGMLSSSPRHGRNLRRGGRGEHPSPKCVREAAAKIRRAMLPAGLLAVARRVARTMP